MALEWEIKRWSPLGVAKPTITSADNVLSIKNWAVDQFGNCQEAFLTALVSGLPSGVGGWEKMQLRYRPVAGSGSWIPLYVGRVMIPGVAKSTDPSEIKLVGLMDKLYKTPATKEFYGSANPATPSDIGAIAREIVNDARVYGGLSSLLLDESAVTPEGASYSSIPNVGAVIGQIQVNGFRVGNLLDLLCESWTGLHWGVNADAKVFLKFYDPTAAGSPTVLTEGVDGCRPEYKPASFEKGCNWVDLYLSVPDTEDTVLFTVKDDASIALNGIEALPNPLVYSGLIEEIPDAEITYSDGVILDGGAGHTSVESHVKNIRFTKGTAAYAVASFDTKLFNDREDGRKFNVIEGNFTWSYSSGSVPIDGFRDLVEFRLTAANVGLIRVQGEFRTNTSSASIYYGIRMYDRDTAAGANTGFPFLKAPSRVALGDSDYNPFSIPAQNVRVDPTKPYHVLALDYQHFPGDTVAHFEFAVSQFRPYRFNLQKINAIAKEAMNTPNPDAVSVRQNTLILPNPKVTLVSALYPTVTKEAKLFKYTFEKLDFGVTQVELEQPQDAASTSTTAIINNKDAKTAITSSQFSASVVSIPASQTTKTLGTPLQTYPLTASATNGTALIGGWNLPGLTDHGEWNADKTVGATGADITWSALEGIPPNTLIYLTAYIEAYDIDQYGLWIGETNIANLNTKRLAVAQSAPGAYTTMATNSGIPVLLDSNGHFKIRGYVQNGGGGNAMFYNLFANTALGAP